MKLIDMHKGGKSSILSIYGNKVFYGHERSNLQVFNVLNDEGFDLLILTNQDGIAEEAKNLLDCKKIPQKAIQFVIWDDMRKPFTVLKIVRYLMKLAGHNWDFIRQYHSFRPDYIFIANDFMYINLLPALLFIKAPVVYRLGDAPVIAWKPFRFLWKNVIVKRTTKFVCISSFIKEKLMAVGRNPLAPDPIIYNYPPERVNTHFTPINYAKKGITFSYLGQIIEIKGVADFIDAAIITCQRTTETYFLLAGSLTYDASFSLTQKNKVEEANLADRIIFLGPVENIEDFFRKTDVLVTPSLKQEPLGNVIVEAKANRTPSIIYKSGGMPELITHGIDGYICQRSTADELVKALNYYLNNPNSIPIQGNNAFKSIKDLQIDFESFVSNWNEVFFKKMKNI